ncbi:sialidase family protein [Nonomuraea angiospora]|uniref:sialidase family protein n=1 Tax=Nonomuraea angiospora TaxID=46172 RepID=UPI0033193453
MPQPDPHHPLIGRRAFGLGVAAASLTVALGPALPANATTSRRRATLSDSTAFDETTLWDNTVDPLESYHVHGLAVLPDDTILVVTEGRHEVCDAGPRDLLVRRSPDGGDTWQPTRTLVASAGGQSWGNPTFVVDRLTGGIFLFYMLSTRLPANTGCSGDKGDLFMISSADGGLTWSAPRDMSGLFSQFPYEWTLHGPGPGHGIQLDNGRLLLNCAHRREVTGNTVAERRYGVASIYSDDHGRTWRATGEVPVSADYPINEARLIQRSDGTVLINGRAAAGGNRQRIVSVSADRGLSWSPPQLDGGHRHVQRRGRQPAALHGRAGHVRSEPGAVQPPRLPRSYQPDRVDQLRRRALLPLQPRDQRGPVVLLRARPALRRQDPAPLRP